MKQLPRFTTRYFNKYSTNPVKLKPYDTQAGEVAKEYIRYLSKMLTKKFTDIQITHRGSTAYGIEGKGDIEIGLYVPRKKWYEIIILLVNHYKSIGNLESNYARFNDTSGGFDIEIITMTDYVAIVDKKLQEILSSRSDLQEEYIAVKRKYAYSVREYQIQKDIFFRKIIDLL